MAASADEFLDSTGPKMVSRSKIHDATISTDEGTRIRTIMLRMSVRSSMNWVILLPPHECLGSTGRCVAAAGRGCREQHSELGLVRPSLEMLDAYAFGHVRHGDPQFHCLIGG